MAVQGLLSNFDAAASYLSSASALAKVSTAIKLELYGLYKYVTVSPMPNLSRPSIFDMTGRAKWDAWSTAGKTYSRGEDAQQRYIEIARNLGWTEEIVIETELEVQRADSEDIWDDESQRARSGGNGMGGAVSTMASSTKLEADESIHGLAVSNDIPSLTALLDKYPDTDLDGLDEFGYTPLHLASDRGNISVVEMLVSKGADTSIKDPDGLSASELAHIAGHDKIQEALLSPP